MPSGVATLVNSHLIRVLKAIRKLGTEDPAKLVNETKLDLETFEVGRNPCKNLQKYLERYGTLIAECEAVLDAAKML